ncbi:tyrosine-type recombinase/integrase [Acinetobacter terrae]|uniref:Tyrosine-type recombinase/integrase n=1 Tax=Acinetobacter terrae TaxID=2731247 RepID=A0A8E4FBA2_9GAMM|nr:tyrosine-type recombinase/integrase [Acinetobacter terrae]NNH39583.1 tyrosine-type recombinase/integrase [Acinetobacter terrae]
MNTYKNNILLINEDYVTSYPQNNTPVSYNRFNNIVSRFEDDVWDFSDYIYTPNAKRKIYFNSFDHCKNIKLRNSIVYEFKLIMYGLIYCNTNTSKQASIQTLTGEYVVFLKTIFNIAINCNSTLSNLSKNHLLLKKIFEYISFLTRQEFHKLPTIFMKIGGLSTTFKNHDFSLNNEQTRHLYNFGKILKNVDYKQHLVIPSSLYLGLNSFIDKKLSEFLKDFVHIYNLYSFKEFGKNSLNNFKKYIEENNISIIYNNKKIKNYHHFILYILNIIYLAQTKLLMFTGMRHAEVILLPYNCFEKINLNNKIIHTISGYTSKLTKLGPTKTTWITSSQSQIPINVLQAITKLFLNSLNVNLDSYDHSKVPLACFFHPTYLKDSYSNPLFDFPIKKSVHIKSALKAFNFDTKLDIKSVKELKLTTSLSDIENYKLEVNSHFPLTPHQFRRSLAVYTARSGYVNIPALKAQLKHISKDMTIYYTKNAMNTINLFDNEFIDILNSEIDLDQYLNFKGDVIDSMDKLYGGEGSRLQNAKDSSHVPLFLTDEKTTLKAIKEGKMTYIRTPLGGCSRVGSCEEIAELTITACITCKDAIFSSRTDNALKIALRNFQNQLRNLPETSPHAIHLTAEITQINALIQKRKQLMENNTND